MRPDLKPRALRAGDRVAIVAPASAFARDEFDAGVIELRQLGFEPVNCGALMNARYLEPLAMLVGELAYNQGKRPEVGLRVLRRVRSR